MFYEDDKLKQKYYQEFATLFIANGFGEEGESVEDIIGILNEKGGKFVVTDTNWISGRATNINGNVFVLPNDAENKALVFHEIFHTLIKGENRNGLHFNGIKEDFSDFEDYGNYANEGAINCLVAKMLNLEYSGEVQNIDNKPIRYKMDAYVEPTRIMEQVNFFVGSRCLVRAMRFDPQILNDEFDRIAKQEGTFASIRDKLDSIQGIESRIDKEMVEYSNATEKGDNAQIQFATQQIKSYLDQARELFQAAQATIIYNCFTKKIKEADSQNQVNASIREVDKFASLGLAENANSFVYLRTLINQKLTSYSENEAYKPIGTEDFKTVILGVVEDIRQGEFSNISSNIRSDLTLGQDRQVAEEKKGETR